MQCVSMQKGAASTEYPATVSVVILPGTERTRVLLQNTMGSFYEFESQRSAHPSLVHELELGAFTELKE